MHELANNLQSTAGDQLFCGESNGQNTLDSRSQSASLNLTGWPLWLEVLMFCNTFIPHQRGHFSIKLEIQRRFFLPDWG